MTTGTPIENHLGELWSLFRFLNPGLLHTQDQFMKRFMKQFDYKRLKAWSRVNLRAVVFSQFVKHLKLIREHLDKAGISYQYLDGSTSMTQRKERVDAFQAGEGDVFLISLKAGGSGLNLTEADYVVHMDPWWNPAVEDQASDRAHRIGQTRPVTVYRLVAENTIEQKIIKLHQQKRDLADSLLEGGDISGSLGAKEMLALIRDI